MPSPRPARLALLAAPAATLALAACGEASSPAKPAAATADNNAMKFSKCMRKHGIEDFPDPEISAEGIRYNGNGPKNVAPQTIKDAQSACERFQAGGREPPLTPQQNATREKGILRLSKCLREHGDDVHLATSSGSGLRGVESDGGSAPNPESAAAKACEGPSPGPRSARDRGPTRMRPNRSNQAGEPGKGGANSVEIGG